jgi:hypothetical protein
MPEKTIPLLLWGAIHTLRSYPVQLAKDCSMLHPTKLPASVLMLAIALAACATDPTAATPVSGICDAAAAQQLVGQLKPTDAEAMRLTGATLVRQIAPGDAVTHDLRDNRVTVATDPASGRVVLATCG